MAGNSLKSYSVGETLDRLEAVLREKGVTVFARIDHSAGAKDAGLTLRPTRLLIFGNPKAGTSLMQAAPTIGLDLPLKVLAWEDDAGKVHVVWNSPAYLIERHGLEAGYTKNLAAIEGLIGAALKLSQPPAATTASAPRGRTAPDAKESDADPTGGTDVMGSLESQELSPRSGGNPEGLCQFRPLTPR